MNIDLTAPVYIPPAKVDTSAALAAQDDADRAALAGQTDDSDQADAGQNAGQADSARADRNRADDTRNDSGHSFMDIVFARLAAEKAADGAAGAKNGANQTTGADAGQQDQPLALQLTKPNAAAAATATAQNAALSATTLTATTAKPVNAQTILSSLAGDQTLDSATRKKLTDFINSLLAGTPSEPKAGAPANGAAQGSLIAAGLTPEKLAELVAAFKKKTDADTNAAAAGMIQLQPPVIQRDPVFTPGALSLQVKGAGQGGAKNGAGSGSGDDIAAQVNPLTVDSNGQSQDAAGAGANAGNQGQGQSQGFGNILKIFEQAQHTAAAAGTGTGAAAPGAANATPHVDASVANASRAAEISAALSTITGAGTGTPGLDFDSATSSQIFPDGIDPARQSTDTAGSGLVQGLPVTGPAVATSLVVNAAEVSSPHPTTQIVASAIVRGAADGQSKAISLRLDPPELGKVEVKMSIDKDQSVKAHVVVEKPETYLMLQRDSHVLQRALNDAGLTANGNSLSFELNQNGAGANQNNQGGGQNGGGGTGSSGADANGNVLETTMNWSFNDATGQTHYSILA